MAPKRVRIHLEKVDKYITSSDFNMAKTSLYRAKNNGAPSKVLNEYEEKIKTAETIYEAKKNEYTKSIAKHLMDANMEEAKKCFEEMKNLWPLIPEINEWEYKINMTERVDKINELFFLANEQLSKGNYFDVKTNIGEAKTRLAVEKQYHPKGSFDVFEQDLLAMERLCDAQEAVWWTGVYPRQAHLDKAIQCLDLAEKCKQICTAHLCDLRHRLKLIEPVVKLNERMIKKNNKAKLRKAAAKAKAEKENRPTFEDLKRLENLKQFSKASKRALENPTSKTANASKNTEGPKTCFQPSKDTQQNILSIYLKDNETKTPANTSKNTEFPKTCLKTSNFDSQRNFSSSSYMLKGNALNNVHEAERCIEIAQTAIFQQEFDKARHMLNKAERMCPSARAKDLLKQIDNMKTQTAVTPKTPGEAKKMLNNLAKKSLDAKKFLMNYNEKSVEEAVLKKKEISLKQLKAMERVRNAKDSYEVLGLPRACDLKQVKSTYRRLTLLLHPDKNKEPEAKEIFMKIIEAMEQLTEEKKMQK